jgi:hypothetical protein
VNTIAERGKGLGGIVVDRLAVGNKDRLVSRRCSIGEPRREP